MKLVCLVTHKRLLKTFSSRLIFNSTFSNMNENTPKNILGTALQACCMEPRTGFFRDGYCNTNRYDGGSHVVCAILTKQFLDYTKNRGNDLSTPRPEFNFPGLKPGDGWCLCALRWKEAELDGCAPPIKPESTHKRALDFIPLETLKKYFVKKEDTEQAHSH